MSVFPADKNILLVSICKSSAIKKLLNYPLNFGVNFNSVVIIVIHNISNWLSNFLFDPYAKKLSLKIISYLTRKQDKHTFPQFLNLCKSLATEPTFLQTNSDSKSSYYTKRAYYHPNYKLNLSDKISHQTCFQDNFYILCVCLADKTFYFKSKESKSLSYSTASLCPISNITSSPSS